MLSYQLRDVFEDQVGRLAVWHLLLVSRVIDPRFGGRIIPHLQNQEDEIFVRLELGLRHGWRAVELFTNAADDPFGLDWDERIAVQDLMQPLQSFFGVSSISKS